MFFKILFFFSSFKIDSRTLDPDPKSMYLNPQHWYKKSNQKT